MDLLSCWGKSHTLVTLVNKVILIGNSSKSYEINISPKRSRVVALTVCQSVASTYITITPMDTPFLVTAQKPVNKVIAGRILVVIIMMMHTYTNSIPSIRFTLAICALFSRSLKPFPPLFALLVVPAVSPSHGLSLPLVWSLPPSCTVSLARVDICTYPLLWALSSPSCAVSLFLPLTRSLSPSQCPHRRQMVLKVQYKTLSRCAASIEWESYLVLGLMVCSY